MKVVGYHGTTADAAEGISQGFIARENGHDWLGTGKYFWQDGETRARIWARQRAKAMGQQPVVIVAEIELGTCVDLLDLRDFKALRTAYDKFREFEKENINPNKKSLQSGLVVLRGRQFTTSDGSSDLRTRAPIENYRDCAFIDWYIRFLEEQKYRVDTVRAPFLSGNALFKQSFLFDWSHVQICVINNENILSKEVRNI